MARFGIAHRFVDTHEMERAGLPREPARPLLPLQERAVRGARPAARRARLRRGRLRREHRRHAATSGPATARRRSAACSRRSSTSALARRRSARSRAPPGCRPRSCPASACLASRLPYGTEVTRERLARWSRPRSGCARSASASCACATTARSRASRSSPTELPRALDPEMARAHRRGAQAARLPLRRARPRGLPHGRAQRGAPARERRS